MLRPLCFQNQWSGCSRRTDRVIIVDSASTYPPPSAWLHGIANGTLSVSHSRAWVPARDPGVHYGEPGAPWPAASFVSPAYDDVLPPDCSVSVELMGQNLGPRAFIRHKPLWTRMPQLFAWTDPDMEMSLNMPCKMLSLLATMPSELRVFKAGLALNVSAGYLIPGVVGKWKTRIVDLEHSFWMGRIKDHKYAGLEIYEAHIDTTFEVYNKICLGLVRTPKPKGYEDDPMFLAVRVAGEFTAHHIPWYDSYWGVIPLEELSVMYPKRNGTSISTISKFAREKYKLK